MIFSLHPCKEFEFLQSFVFNRCDTYVQVLLLGIFLDRVSENLSNFIFGKVTVNFLVSFSKYGK